MSSDEVQIRDLTEKWQAATMVGNTEAVLQLMTDDVVFLVAGRPPMSKDQFAALMATPTEATRPRIELKQHIREIEVFGDFAYMWSELHVVVTPPGASKSSEREGHVLSVFKKCGGRWLLARDANLLAPKP